MPAGEIILVIYWYGDMTEAVELGEVPPEVPVNTTFNLGCGWLNRGTAYARGHIEAVVTKPDGAKVDLEGVLNQDIEAPPEMGAVVGLSPFNLDQAGNYQAEFILSMEEAAPISYALTMGFSGQGSIDPPKGSYSFEAGTQVPILATPASGWEFNWWLIDGYHVEGSLQVYTRQYTLIMDRDKTAVAYFYQLPPPEESIQQQLGSCWNYISGCGTRVDNKVVWAYRNGVYLMYDSQDPLHSDLTAFMSGDIAYMYLTQACRLTHIGYDLVPGWNEFTWP